MSTLVKFILALVLHVFHQGDLPENDTVFETKTEVSKYTVQQLNPQYIITRDELLSHKKETAI